MYQAIKTLLKQFAEKKMTLEQLNGELLALNPYMVTDLRWAGWENWINGNVEEYTKGNEYVLSLESSQSILYAIDEDEEENEDDFFADEDDYMLGN